MIINDQHKYIFISIPKTGSTSIMSVLDPDSVHEKPEIYHQTLSELIKEQGNEIKGYSVIFVYRDPFARLASVYFDSIKDKNHVTLKDIAKYNSFYEFVDDLPKSKLHKKIRHLWPQKKFVEHDESNLKLKNKAFYFEEFNKVKHYITSLSKKTCSAKIPLHRRTSNSRPPLYKIYDLRILRIAMDIYREDFENSPRYYKSFAILALKVLVYKFVAELKKKVTRSFKAFFKSS